MILLDFVMEKSIKLVTLVFFKRQNLSELPRKKSCYTKPAEKGALKLIHPI